MEQRRARGMLAAAAVIFGTLAPFVRGISVSSGELALYRAVMAALLVGGASVDRASIGNVFLGVILFHTMFIVAPRTGTVITGDSMIGEYFRVFVSYAVITIALVMYEAKKRKAKSAAGLQLAADQLAEEEAKAK